jgi:hypothetical protein
VGVARRVLSLGPDALAVAGFEEDGTDAFAVLGASSRPVVGQLPSGGGHRRLEFLVAVGNRDRHVTALAPLGVEAVAPHNPPVYGVVVVE